MDAVENDIDAMLNTASPGLISNARSRGVGMQEFVEKRSVEEETGRVDGVRENPGNNLAGLLDIEAELTKEEVTNEKELMYMLHVLVRNGEQLQEFFRTESRADYAKNVAAYQRRLKALLETSGWALGLLKAEAGRLDGHSERSDTERLAEVGERRIYDVDVLLETVGDAGDYVADRLLAFDAVLSFEEAVQTLRAEAKSRAARRSILVLLTMNRGRSAGALQSREGGEARREIQAHIEAYQKRIKGLLAISECAAGRLNAVAHANSPTADTEKPTASTKPSYAADEFIGELRTAAREAKLRNAHLYDLLDRYFAAHKEGDSVRATLAGLIGQD